MAGSFSGRTTPFEGAYVGSIPTPAANNRSTSGEEMGLISPSGAVSTRASDQSCCRSPKVRRVAVDHDKLGQYQPTVPKCGGVAHRQSGGLQTRVREGSIPSSPAILK